MSDMDRVIQKSEKDIGLSGIFGEKDLEELARKLSEATDFSFTVIDYRGNNIIDEIICNDYCVEHKESPACSECRVTAAFAAAKAAIAGSPYFFSCPKGLCSIAVPIIINEQYLGALVGGRIRCPEEEAEIDIGDEVPVFTRKRVEAIGDLMLLMLKEMGDKEILRKQIMTDERRESRLIEISNWNTSLREELKKSELKSMRARIYPQFLLDLLVTIANFAVIEDAVMTEDVVVKTASILRYYLDESGELATLDEELRHIRTYLEVLRSKYEDKFDFHLKIGDDIKQVRVPVLVMFPLLGYVLNYGVFSSYFKGILFMDVESDGNYCLITMQLENRNHSVRTPVQNKADIMDSAFIQKQLADTARRLEYVYGDDYILELKPDIVTLRFPEKTNNMEVMV